MEIGEFPVSFSVLFYSFPSLSTGLAPSDFWGVGWGKRGRKAGERSLVSGRKARQRKSWEEWYYVHQLRRGMKVKFSTTLTECLPHTLLTFTFLVRVWPQSSGNHSDSCILTEFSNKQFLCWKTQIRALIPYVPPAIHTHTHTHTNTHTYELHGQAEVKTVIDWWAWWNI